MGEFFFVLKTFVFSLLVILVLQLRIGSMTLEERSLRWMHESKAVVALQGVADSAAILIDQGYRWTKSMAKRQLGMKETPARSNQVVKKQAWEKELEAADNDQFSWRGEDAEAEDQPKSRQPTHVY